MASLDDLKKRITSVKSTQKITKAMKMVAAAKLKRAQDSAEKGRPYSEKMNNIILNLSSGISDKETAPKLLSGSGKEHVHLCVVLTSDRGLCGGFNGNIIKKAKSYFAKLNKEGKELKIITVGSKGNDQLKRVYGNKIIENISFKNSKNANYFDAEKVGKIVIEKFQKEEFDICTIFYNQFKNVITQIPQAQQIIPLNTKKDNQDNPTGILKDNAIDLCRELIPADSQDDLDKALYRAIDFALSRGITQVHDMGSFSDLVTYQRALSSGKLKIRVKLFTWYTN